MILELQTRGSKLGGNRMNKGKPTDGMSNGTEVSGPEDLMRTIGLEYLWYSQRAGS